MVIRGSTITHHWIHSAFISRILMTSKMRNINKLEQRISKCVLKCRMKIIIFLVKMLSLFILTMIFLFFIFFIYNLAEWRQNPYKFYYDGYWRNVRTLGRYFQRKCWNLTFAKFCAIRKICIKFFSSHYKNWSSAGTGEKSNFLNRLKIHTTLTSIKNNEKVKKFLKRPILCPAATDYNLIHLGRF